MMPTEDAPTVVGSIGVVFVVVVNIELPAPNECATQEPAESTGMGWEPPSATAKFNESRLVVALGCYNVVGKNENKGNDY